MTDSDDRQTAVVLLSGGMDSATTAYEAKARGYDLYCLHTSYGQKTETKEYDCATQLAEELDAEEFLHIETDHLSDIGASSLTDDEIDVEDADMDAEEIPTSYVPFRNANLLSMAVSFAEANDCDAVFVGAHSEDYAGYPDCRPEFFEAFEAMVDTGTKPETNIDIEVPFVTDSKTDIAQRGRELDVPFEHTWSCYRAEEPACGTCDSCAYRLQAFRNVGMRDPIPYAERPEYAESE
ncbi:preq(0) biosynthesis protein quec [Halogeometricum borinquense DSM 11551]|uniref:7-cyano-7-deazaguanine synthase n=2 Tax=Halogeometricum borinquense TaxID=60847 RepID=E4NTL2_HALBP|nr:7-cyano-7-deazaguanine synthase QueC [Halogeometricum borinquense]ADQ67064.1 preQ(0) biosynthesis protein QueC [Halogeometricum borinquense DSM 11551]ELY29611.1 preq(0) biosynthesis protein quec [Halogeometricum borinquense DSM 11551]RYJ15380.1 7-cyano-7-deazaguanine synthase QueC [Halogeometricum borinquense]